MTQGTTVNSKQHGTGTIVSINGSKAVVDFNGVEKTILTFLLKKGVAVNDSAKSTFKTAQHSISIMERLNKLNNESEYYFEAGKAIELGDLRAIALGESDFISQLKDENKIHKMRKVKFKKWISSEYIKKKAKKFLKKALFSLRIILIKRGCFMNGDVIIKNLKTERVILQLP